jgi:hypothetical protein
MRARCLEQKNCYTEKKYFVWADKIKFQRIKKINSHNYSTLCKVNLAKSNKGYFGNNIESNFQPLEIGQFVTSVNGPHKI